MLLVKSEIKETVSGNKFYTYSFITTTNITFDYLYAWHPQSEMYASDGPDLELEHL